MFSNSLTPLHMVTLANDGIFGSWDISSNILIAFAALIPILADVSVSISVTSFKVFLMFLGVEELSDTCLRMFRAFFNAVSFSIFFFALNSINH